MSRTNADFTLRSFIEEVKADDAAALWRITDRVDLDHDITAWAMELERLGSSNYDFARYLARQLAGREAG